MLCPLKFSVGLAPCGSANAKRSRKFHRPYAALLGTTLALQLLSLSPFSVAMDVERLIMTVRVKFERNKMSRGYRLLWSDDLFQSRNPSEWNGIVGKTRESLTWAQDLLKCWSKKKTRLNDALLDEHSDIRGGTWSRFLIAAVRK